MRIQIKIKKIITPILLFFIIMMAVNIPREASAFTLKTEEVISAIHENKKESSQSMGQPGRFLLSMNDQVQVALSQKKPDVSFQTEGHQTTFLTIWTPGHDQSRKNRYHAEGEKSFSSDQDSILGKRDSDFNLIKGDFCLTALKYSDRFSHFSEDRDDLRHIPSPAPVPLPATALLLGTGLGALAGLTTSRKRFFG